MPTDLKNHLLRLDPGVDHYSGRPTYGLSGGVKGAANDPIYVTPFSSTGNSLPDQGYGYVFNGNNIASGQSRVTSVFNNNNNYGKTKFLIRIPKTIVVTWNVGWYYMEHYPMYIGTQSNYDTSWESIYFTPPNAGAGGLEKTIDYYVDFGNAINAFGQANKISVLHTYKSLDIPYNGPTISPITIRSTGLSDFTLYTPIALISRWMFDLVPRYRFPTGDDIFFGVKTTPVGNHVYLGNDDEKYIVGGEVLHIVFATDAYSAYHGCSTRVFNSTLTDLSTAGSSAMMTEDLNTLKRRSNYFKKWGCILVNSPKNPEFFPLWLQDAATTSPTFTPQAYCLYDAQQHFQQVNSMLSGFNFTLLMRNTHFGASPSPRHSIYEDQHLTFSRPQITVNEIMQAVQQFWGV